MKQLKVILIGAGDRGTTYTDIMANLPEQFKVVAVAEPIESRRQHIKELHNIPDDMCFTDYKPLLALGKIADLAVIATMDRDHFEPSMKAISLKYDILLEKPITPTPEECIALCDWAKINKVKVVVCTVLRYTFLFQKLKEIIDSGKIGDVISINHEECVGYTHQSHSFVRGRWGNSERSSPMLLQKSCHDIDILQWLIGKQCKQVQSFGNLTHFTQKNAPKGSPEYCIEGCPHAEKCKYNAVRLYLDDKENMWFRRSSTDLYNPTDADVEHTLRTTQYGKCIYKCDNDVVDHQTVNMLFEDDITVTFTMTAFAVDGRYINIMGTKGQVRASLGDNSPIKIFSFSNEFEEIESIGSNSITAGHGGGDTGIVKTLYDYIIGDYDDNCVPTIEESCYNHLVVFAAEASRKENCVINVKNYIKNLNMN
ncbi:MAG: Gfo/Idh/MocA family oxidoreductase [Clostridia bacterium]|nr:Gfo/Idh/MocA family oxidoreductase [Clostridia bacterium]